MHRKIILPVDKLIGRATFNKQKPTHKQQAQRRPNFEDLYQMIRKNSQARHSVNYPPSKNMNNHQSTSNCRYTPQNSNRIHLKEDSVHELRRSLQNLNRSLQSKNNERTEKNLTRSMSNESKCKAKSVVNITHFQGEQKKPEVKVVKNNNFFPPKDIESEYRDLVEHLDHQAHQHLRETQCFLNNEEVYVLADKLHFIKNQQSRKLLSNLWQDLQGDMYGGIPSENLLKFFIYITQPPNDQLRQQNQQIHKKCVTIDKNLKIQVTQKQKQIIFKKYFPFRVNRVLHNEGLGKKYQKNQPHREKQNQKIKIIDELSTSQEKHKCREQIKKSNISKEKSENKQNFIQKNEKTSNIHEKMCPSKKSIKLKSPTEATKKKVQLRQISNEISNVPPGHPSIIRRTPFLRNKQNDQNMLKMLHHGSEQIICYSEFSEEKPNISQEVKTIQTEASPKCDIIQQVVIKKPILSVDVNIGEGLSEKLIVFQGQTANDVSRRLVEKYNIDENLRLKFEAMLHSHIRNLLWKIEEVSEDMFSDRQQ